MKVNEHMKRERRRRGLTVPQLAEKTGICESTIYGYESGARSPRLEYLIWICKAIGTTLDGYIGVDYDA